MLFLCEQNEKGKRVVILDQLTHEIKDVTDSLNKISELYFKYKNPSDYRGLSFGIHVAVNTLEVFYATPS